MYAVTMQASDSISCS